MIKIVYMWKQERVLSLLNYINVGSESAIFGANAYNWLVKEAIFWIAAETEFGEFTVVEGSCLVQDNYVRALLNLLEAVGVLWIQVNQVLSILLIKAVLNLLWILQAKRSALWIWYFVCLYV